MRLRLRVKEVANARSVSMTRLHITSEVAYSTIRRVFRDPYVEVTTTTINRLARALDVAPTSLLEDVPDESEESPRS